MVYSVEHCMCMLNVQLYLCDFYRYSMEALKSADKNTIIHWVRHGQKGQYSVFLDAINSTLHAVHVCFDISFFLKFLVAM